MHRLSTLETNIQTSLFYMEHDLPPRSQIVKLGQVEYPRWPPLLKIAKIIKSIFLQNRWIFLAEFWHGISMEHRYSECKKEKIGSVVLSQ